MVRYFRLICNIYLFIFYKYNRNLTFGNSLHDNIHFRIIAFIIMLKYQSDFNVNGFISNFEFLIKR